MEDERSVHAPAASGVAGAAPDTSPRQRLIETAARLLGEDGPSALTTRRLAKETQTSTMSVYTHFGGMPALIGAVVAEGFARLHQRVADVPLTDDPLADLKAAAVAYRDNARANPHLYAVMFGRSGPRAGIDGPALDVAMRPLLGAVTRCIRAGVLRDVDPRQAALSIWASVHGLVSLEIAGYVDDDPDILEQHLVATAAYWLAAPLRNR